MANPGLAALAGSVQGSEPMFRVRDMRASVRWYQDIGFALLDQHEDSGELLMAKLGFGNCRLGLTPGAAEGPRDVSLWLYTNQVADLFQRLKDASDTLEIRFEEELYEPFYGGRQFSILDRDGLELIFWQPEWLMPDAPGSV